MRYPSHAKPVPFGELMKERKRRGLGRYVERKPLTAYVRSVEEARTEFLSLHGVPNILHEETGVDSTSGAMTFEEIASAAGKNLAAVRMQHLRYPFPGCYRVRPPMLRWRWEVPPSREREAYIASGSPKQGRAA